MEQQLLVEVPAEWVEHCIDYTHLCTLAATKTATASGALNGDEVAPSTTDGIVVETTVSPSSSSHRSHTLLAHAISGEIDRCGAFVMATLGLLEGKLEQFTETEVSRSSSDRGGSCRECGDSNYPSVGITSTPAVGGSSAGSVGGASEYELRMLDDEDARLEEEAVHEVRATSLLGHHHHHHPSHMMPCDADSKKRDTPHQCFKHIRLQHLQVLKLQRFAILNAKAVRHLYNHQLDFSSVAAGPSTNTSSSVAGHDEKSEQDAHHHNNSTSTTSLLRQTIESRLAASTLCSCLPHIERLALRFEVLLRAYYAEDFDDAVRGEDDVDSSKLVSWTVKWHFIILAVTIFAIVLIAPMKLDDDAHRCAAMIAAVSVLWVTEAIPFFCTAMLIPLIAAPLEVIPGKTRTEAGALLLGKTFDHTQILVLGGLCIGKALAKHKLEVAASRLLLRRVAHRPKLYLLAVMTLACAACAFVSNVAAPLLMLSVIQPTLWELDRATGAPQAILLALAFACNFGGMLSPIASPQNAVALQALGPRNQINFGTWVACALPLVAVGILLVWAVILLVWKPFKDVAVIPIPLGGHGANLDQRKHQRGYHGEATTKEKVEVGVVITVSVVTVVLWCIPSSEGVGDSGVIALIPIVAFFGMGILTKDDFNSLSWHLMFLLAGGNILGLCARESKFLEQVVLSMEGFLTTNSSFTVMLTLLLAVALITSFVSHTVASLILMPVIVEVAGINNALPSPAVMVFCAVMMVSGSMAFPVTSFPNVNSLLAEDTAGAPYLRGRNFISVGLVVSAAVLLQLISYMIPMTEAVLPGHPPSPLPTKL